MRNFVLLISLCVFCVSCKSDDDSLSTNQEIVDTWIWESSSGGIDGSVITPEILGNHYALVLSDDQSYVILTNEEQTHKGTYSIIKKESIYTGKKENYIQLNGEVVFPVFNGIVSIDNGILLISDNLYDGYSSAFNKSTINPNKHR